jgi:hypothetical protein
MNIEEHFDEDTDYIKLGEFTPFANSKPIENFFMNKKVKKQLKESGYTSTSHMNVIYESGKPFRIGDIYKWKLHDLEIEVVMLGKTQLFVKGKYVYAYCVGIIEND